MQKEIEIEKGKKIDTFTARCPKCSKIITSTSENQLKWNMMVHMQTHEKEKMKNGK